MKCLFVYELPSIKDTIYYIIDANEKEEQYFKTLSGKILGLDDEFSDDELEAIDYILYAIGQYDSPVHNIGEEIYNKWKDCAISTDVKHHVDISDCTDMFVLIQVY